MHTEPAYHDPQLFYHNAESVFSDSDLNYIVPSWKYGSDIPSNELSPSPMLVANGFFLD